MYDRAEADAKTKTKKTLSKQGSRTLCSSTNCIQDLISQLKKWFATVSKGALGQLTGDEIYIFM